MGKSGQVAPESRRLKAASSYFADSLAELKKVHAPSKQEAWQHTISVLSLIIFFSLVLAVMDWVFRGIMWRLI